MTRPQSSLKIHNLGLGKRYSNNVGWQGGVTGTENDLFFFGTNLGIGSRGKVLRISNPFLTPWHTTKEMNILASVGNLLGTCINQRPPGPLTLAAVVQSGSGLTWKVPPGTAFVSKCCRALAVTTSLWDLSCHSYIAVTTASCTIHPYNYLYRTKYFL